MDKVWRMSAAASWFDKRFALKTSLKKRSFSTFSFLHVHPTPSRPTSFARFFLVHDTKTGKNVPNEPEMY
jgi:hypothetical protein